ncbi:MAG: polysaccharide pyruvyl transferase family protein [Propionibacteriaceae bacterium]|jgi:polysaccharide pyruvyl transferase WcaK-like protein/glycosyltransferase involved in cell wall biosynthesis|nr:polysaccharide pyruvyl transferase family protein [Propionibacteriaceae bacterium]
MVTPPLLRVAVVVDVGQEVYHVGDEAIGSATAQALQARGCQPVLFARQPSLVRIPGCQVEPAPQITWDPAARIALCEEAEAIVAALTAPDRSSDPAETLLVAGVDLPDDPFHAPASDLAVTLDRVVAVVASCDAVLVAGGGSLNSTYGWLLAQRCLIARIARRLGKPVALTGQTIGPALSFADAPLVADLVSSAVLAGVRDAASRELVEGLGVIGVETNHDDATVLALASSSVRDRRPETDGDSIVATFSAETFERGGDESYAQVARMLSRLSRSLDRPVVFQPHMQTTSRQGDGDGFHQDGDAAVHRRIADLMPPCGHEPRLEQIRDATSTVSSYQRAALVVTSRFHPVVFGLASAVPVLAIAANGYTAARIDGAFTNWGLPDMVAPLTALADPAFDERCDAFLAAAPSLSRYLTRRQPMVRADLAAWWDHLVAALAPELSSPLVGSGAPAVNDHVRVPETLSSEKELIPDALSPWCDFIRRYAASLQRSVEEDRVVVDTYALRSLRRVADPAVVTLSPATPDDPEVPAVNEIGVVEAGLDHEPLPIARPEEVEAQHIDPGPAPLPPATASLPSALSTSAVSLEDRPPRVAILMRTKDRPDLLARALADVWHQTFTDWRLILVNDGGDPDPIRRLVGLVPAPARSAITVIHNDHSRGMEAAANQALHASDSDYVVIHDDDDTWACDFLERTVARLDAHPEEAGVSATTVIVYEERRGEHYHEIGRAPFYDDLTDLSLSDAMTSNRWVPISFLYRRLVHSEIGGFDEDLEAVGDWSFHLRLLERFRLSRLVPPDGEALAQWRQRPSVSGVEGNSVIAHQREHERCDGIVRDRALRDYVEREGMGLPLYLAGLAAEQRGFIHAESLRLERRIDELENRTAHLGEVLDEILRTVRRTEERVLASGLRERAHRAADVMRGLGKG